MIEASIIILELPDHRLAFQRRRKYSRHFALKLGFFGGSIEPGETPLQAMHRELEEETGLKSDELDISYIDSKSHEVETERTINFNVFRAPIPDVEFEVIDGEGVEVYSAGEALQRSDLTPGTRFILEEMYHRGEV